jgi:putative PIN family toxin of toxin-antitoxin system
VRRVVFDTNVYVSAFITPGGRGEEAYLRAVKGKVELVTSVPILTELALKLREKFKWDDEHIKNACRHIASVAEVFKPKKRISVLADDPDNRILECAMEGKAEMIVTGDKHLLKLKSYVGIDIVTLAAFLEGGIISPEGDQI